MENPTREDQHQHVAGEARRGREIMKEVLIKTSDKTVPRLVLPDIVYNVKRKLGCIFVENHNPESIVLKQGQTIGLVTSCVVTQKEHGQALLERNDARQCVPERSNATESGKGGASVSDVRKQVGKHTVYIQSIENRNFY